MAQNEIRITLSAELKRMIEARAKSLGIKPTEYVRSIIIDDFRREPAKRGA